MTGSQSWYVGVLCEAFAIVSVCVRECHWAFRTCGILYRLLMVRRSEAVDLCVAHEFALLLVNDDGEPIQDVCLCPPVFMFLRVLGVCEGFPHVPVRVWECWWFGKREGA